MKLETADAIIRISELDFLSYPNMKKFTPLFYKAVDWLTKNPPGLCCIDIRACPRQSTNLDCSMFTLDDNNQAAIARRPLEQIYFLEQSFNGKRIAFNTKPLAAWMDGQRISFDWVCQERHKETIMPPEEVIDFQALGLKLYNKFYVSEKIK